jgi:hypothetical protein
MGLSTICLEISAEHLSRGLEHIHWVSINNPYGSGSKTSAL